jgi:hypothetical protein
MDSLGVRRATRTRTGFARVAHSYDRHRAIVDGAFHAKSRRHNRRRMKGSRHRADSFLDSTQVGAPTSSNLSLSQNCAQIGLLRLASEFSHSLQTFRTKIISLMCNVFFDAKDTCKKADALGASAFFLP